MSHYYNYRVGNVERPTIHLGTKVVYLTAGLVLGAYMGCMFVIGQIQAAVQPVITQDSSSVLPIIHAEQGKLGVVGAQNFSSPDDLQPAGGYNNLQRTERPQP